MALMSHQAKLNPKQRLSGFQQTLQILLSVAAGKRIRIRPIQDREYDVIKQVVVLLRKHLQNEEQFTSFVGVLDRAAAAGSALKSLNGAVITREMLAQCLAEVRSAAEFPIRPEAQLLAQPLSPFQRDLRVAAAHDDSCEASAGVSFNMLYVKSREGANVWKILKAPWQNTHTYTTSP